MTTPATASPTYCASNMTDPVCLTWSESGASKDQSVIGALQSWCTQGANIAGSVCQTFCKSTGGTWCDDLAQSYCVTHNTDTSFCGCINLPLDAEHMRDALLAQNKDAVWDPTCYYSPCANSTTAYKSPASSSSKTCPPFSVCEETSLGMATYPNLTQSCASQTSGTTSGSSLSTSVFSSSKSSGLSPWGIFWVVVASLILMLILGIFVYPKIRAKVSKMSQRK